MVASKVAVAKEVAAMAAAMEVAARVVVVIAAVATEAVERGVGGWGGVVAEVSAATVVAARGMW